MFNPVPPRDPDPPEHPDDEGERPRRRKEIDIRHRRYQNDGTDAEMTGGDWALAVICSAIGCIVGIVYLVQNKPKAGKMIGVSIVFSIVWRVLWFMIESSMQRPQVQF